MPTPETPFTADANRPTETGLQNQEAGEADLTSEPGSGAMVGLRSSRRHLLAGAAAGASLIGATAAGAPLTASARPADRTGAGPAAGPAGAAAVTPGGVTFKADLIGQHPRLILGTQVSVAEVKQRATRPAYQDFVAAMVSYSNGRAALPPFTSSPPNDEDWSRIFWGLPEIALSWIITDGTSHRTKLRDWTLYVCDSTQFPEWGSEAGGGLGAAMALTGVAIAYDWGYAAFSAAERTLIRNRLALQAEKMQAQAFDTSVNANAYWKNDFSNNHRHIHIAGLMSASAAIYGDGADDTGADDEARLALAAHQYRQIMTWTAPDGSQHEGPDYANYGNDQIVRSLDIYESVTGISLWDQRVLNIGTFKQHLSLPGLFGQARYANSEGGLHYFNPYLWKIAAKGRDSDLQAFLLAQYAASPAGKNSFSYPSWSVLWHDDTLTASDRSTLDTVHHFPDLDLFAARTDWTNQAVSFHLKSGMVGGRRLNQWRDRFGPNTTTINVAHDHPDAGHWQLAFGGYRWGNYGGRRRSMTKYSNTITVGADIGQANERDNDWFQPYPDMRDRARIAAYARTGPDVLTISEAAKAYQAPSTANLTRFNRYHAFVNSHYTVMIDDIALPAARDIHALFHCAGTHTGTQAAGYHITQNTAANPATLELYLGSPNGEATTTVGASFLPELGTLWRLTQRGRPTAQLITIAYPAINGRTAQPTPPTYTTDSQGTKVVIGHNSQRDTFSARTGHDDAGPLTAPGVAVTANGRALLTRQQAGTLTSSTVIGGTQLTAQYITATTTQPGTISLARTGGTITASTASSTTRQPLTISGLTPRTLMKVTHQGRTRRARTTSTGSLTIDAETNATITIAQ